MGSPICLPLGCSLCFSIYQRQERPTTGLAKRSWTDKKKKKKKKEWKVVYKFTGRV
jgi:hypothetical protein